MPASWIPRRADSKSRILRRPIGDLRLPLGAAQSHPFDEQHIADGQDHRPHKQAEKAVGNHAADDPDQNYRHWDFHSAAEHQWLQDIVAEPGDEGPDQEDDSRLRCFRRKT